MNWNSLPLIASLTLLLDVPSDPSAAAFQKHTYTEGQVIAKMGKLNKRFPVN